MLQSSHETEPNESNTQSRNLLRVIEEGSETPKSQKLIPNKINFYKPQIFELSPISNERK